MIGKSRDRSLEIGRQDAFLLRPTRWRCAIGFRHQQVEPQRGRIVLPYFPNQRRKFVARPRPLALCFEAGLIDGDDGDGSGDALARELACIEVEQSEFRPAEERICAPRMQCQNRDEDKAGKYAPVPRSDKAKDDNLFSEKAAQEFA